MRNKNEDLEILARGLDISPTMHHYTVKRYEAISEHLNTHGIAADFYPQGSFRTGTVVRPIKNGIESDFDIDVVCELAVEKEDSSPQHIKESVGSVLQNSAEYRKKLQPEEDRCWTLKYDVHLTEGVGLVLDIVPCVKESQGQISLLKAKRIPPEFADQAVAITEKNSNGYSWQASNPGGYGDWFDRINRRFLVNDLSEKKARFLADNRALFEANASIEDVPDYYIKSSLQRVIQLLKRHRDIYYGRIKNGKELKPISAILTTLAAKIAEKAPVNQVDELLSFVISGMENYTPLLQNHTVKAMYYGDLTDIIQRQGNRWIICNPVNPDDNYAESWTLETAEAFFRWISILKRDFVLASPTNEVGYFAGLKTGLGLSFVERTLPQSINSVVDSPKPVLNPTKPWRSEDDSCRI